MGRKPTKTYATLEDEVIQTIPNWTKLNIQTRNLITKMVVRLGQLGRLDIADVGALSILAGEYDRWIDLTRQILETKEYETEGKRSPLVAMASQSANQCLAIMKEFGFTSRSRKNLTQRDANTVQSNSLLDEFLD